LPLLPTSRISLHCIGIYLSSRSRSAHNTFPKSLRPHQSISVLGSELSDPFDWQNKGPIELIGYLRSGYKKGGINIFNVSAYRIGWIRRDDLPKLKALVHSTTPCLALQDPLSSFIDPRGATVGAVAQEMIDSYESGGFPTWNRGRVKK
jgi:hypothetical protein